MFGHWTICAKAHVREGRECGDSQNQLREPGHRHFALIQLALRRAGEA